MPRRAQQPRFPDRLSAYARDHVRIACASLGRLYRTPVSSAMTMGVIGIALALPAVLYLLLVNLQAVTGDWDRAAQISLFLRLDTSGEATEALAERLRARQDIGAVRTIGADQALAELRAESGFGGALDTLESNPLPPTVVVVPAPNGDGPEAVAALLRELRQLPEVDIAQLDMQWLRRLYALLDVARRATLAVAAMLGVAVLLVVGNTIRLDIQNRREEIEVTKLIGGTDPFIRRPFLYGGLWYGVLGGALAWLLVYAAVSLVEGPARRLAGLYGSDYRVIGLEFSVALALLAIGATLGLVGSWVAVGRHLHAIEPR